MKYLYLIVAFLATNFTLNAQINLSATIGTPTAYTTLKSAFDAINAGSQQGSIVITISGSTTETATALLSRSGTGPSSYTSLLIYPTATATISGNLASPLIQITGQNVTIDGRINQSGSTRSLTLQNVSTSTSTATSTLRFSNDASNNTIRYTNLEGSSRSNSAGTVSFISTSGTTGIENITISNNDIRPAGATTPLTGIISTGFSGTATNKNITISSNLIHDFFSTVSAFLGIRLNTNNTSWTITGNSFYQSVTRTTAANGSAFYGIYCISGDGYNLSGNYFGGNAPNAGGSPFTIAGAFSNIFYAIYMNTGFTNASNIDGNTVTNISHNFQSTTTGTPFVGFYIATGKVNIGVNAGNIIGAASGTGAINFMANSTANTFCTSIFSQSNAQLDIRNNTIGAISASNSNTGTLSLRAIEIDYNPVLNIQNNIIGGPTAGSIQATSSTHFVQPIIIFANSTGTNYTVTGNTINNIRGVGGNTISYVNGILHLLTTANLIANDNISNNILSNLSTTSLTGESYITAIDVRNNSYAGTSIDGVINNNQVSNLSCASTGSTSGISALNISTSSVTSLSITNNTISGLSSPANSAVGSGNGVVAVDFTKSVSGALTITGNTVNNIENSGNLAATRVVGIGIRYAGNNAIIAKNKIYDLRNPNTTPGGSVVAMLLNGASNTGIFNVANNMIALNAVATSVYGIQYDSVATQINFYYNSVYISGSATGANNSGSFFRNGTSNNTPSVIKDNIFYNTRTGGSGFHYAVMNNSSTPASGWTEDYNVLNTADPLTVTLWDLNSLNLADFQTNSGGIHSKTITVTFVDIDNGDLHVTGGSQGNQELAGIPVSVLDDFEGSMRSAYRPYMGADEGFSTLPVSLINFAGRKLATQISLTWKAVCSGDKTIFTVERGATDGQFHSIGSVTTTQYECNHAVSFNDADPMSGANYYRLKIQDADGKITYSKTIIVQNQFKDFEIVKLYPSTITQNTINLYATATSLIKVNIVVSNMEGKIILKTTKQMLAGTGTITVDLPYCASGQYQVTASSADGYSKTLRFIKQ